MKAKKKKVRPGNATSRRRRLIRQKKGRFVYYDIVGDIRRNRLVKMLAHVRIDSVTPSGKVNITIQSLHGSDGKKKCVSASTLFPLNGKY